MIICPVCEHHQDLGVECEVCGKDLGGLGGLGVPPVPVAPVEGLLVTSATPVGEVPVERLAELMATHHGEVAVVDDPTPDLESTAQGDPGEVPVEPLTDMSMDRAPDDGVRTAVAVDSVTCRYCRTVQAVGVLCERCGMRLPRVIVVAQGAVVDPDAERVRCRSCGAKALPGTRCTDCGAEVPVPTG